jgi:hypothetical protein
MDADAESATAAFICTNVLESGDTCMKGYNDKVSSLVILSLAQFIIDVFAIYTCFTNIMLKIFTSINYRGTIEFVLIKLVISARPRSVANSTTLSSIWIGTRDPKTGATAPNCLEVVSRLQ